MMNGELKSYLLLFTERIVIQTRADDAAKMYSSSLFPHRLLPFPECPFLKYQHI